MNVIRRNLAITCVLLAFIGYAICGNKQDVDRCAPRNDCSGHVKGCKDGKKECLEGWEGDHCTELKNKVDPNHCDQGTTDFPPIPCFGNSTCFNQGCCCPSNRVGESSQCEIEDTQSEDKCRNECPGQYCARIGPKGDDDISCDKRDAETTKATGDDTTTTAKTDSTGNSAGTVAVSFTLLSAFLFGLLVL